ncbi:MAG: MarR family transcriptional regulator [Candidatus Aenigmatarchaeota archaeon]
MKMIKVIGIILIIVAIVVAGFGVWLKSYNNKIAVNQIDETGTCYLSDGTCLHATSDSILYLTVAIAAVLAVVGGMLLLRKSDSNKIIVKKIYQNKPKSIQEEITIPKTLPEDQKKIIHIVKESNGAMLQGELVAKSGLDKVKVSRLLDKLEMQGLIERRRHGMSNLVVLKRK